MLQTYATKLTYVKKPWNPFLKTVCFYLIWFLSLWNPPKREGGGG